MTTLNDKPACHRSTLEDTREYIHEDSMPTLYGKYKVPYFDVKGDLDRYFKNIGLPTTYFLAPFYWEVEGFTKFGVCATACG